MALTSAELVVGDHACHLGLGLLAAKQMTRFRLLQALLSNACKTGVGRRSVHERGQVRMDVDGQLDATDVIPNGQSLVVFSRKGYIKRMPASTFAVQVPSASCCMCDSASLMTQAA